MHGIPTIAAHGAQIPAIGLGTWPMKGQECERAVVSALQAGYRHVDTAAFYGNEIEVGRGLKGAGVARDSVFVTTKVWAEDIGAGKLQASAEASLKRLGLAVVDLLLIHWPNPAIPLKECIRALADAKRRGLTRHIGVSNFPSTLLREAVALSPEPIVTNQIEHHPHLDNRVVIGAARALGVSITAYCPLGRGATGGVMSEPEVLRIAAAHGKTPAQIVLRWHLQQSDVIAVPKSATPARIAANLAVTDFALSHADMAALEKLAKPDGRVVKTAWAPEWD